MFFQRMKKMAKRAALSTDKPAPAPAPAPAPNNNAKIRDIIVGAKEVNDTNADAVCYQFTAAAYGQLKILSGPWPADEE